MANEASLDFPEVSQLLFELQGIVVLVEGPATRKIGRGLQPPFHQFREEALHMGLVAHDAVVVLDRKTKFPACRVGVAAARRSQGQLEFCRLLTGSRFIGVAGTLGGSGSIEGSG